MIKTLNIFDEIILDGKNPRDDTCKHYDDELQALVDSLRSTPLQNLPSVNLCDGEYTLIQGHRRVAALRKLHEENPVKYGDTVDCVVFESLLDEEIASMRLAENIARDDLSCVEIGRELIRLKAIAKERDPKITDIKIAESVGLDKSRFSQHIKITRLPRDTCGALQSRLLSMAHAEQLARLLPKVYKNQEEQPLDPELAEKIDKLADKVILNGLSEEKLGKIIDGLLDKKSKKPEKEPLKGVYKKAQNALTAHFGNYSVQVKPKSSGGCSFIFDVADSDIADVQAMLIRGEPAHTASEPECTDGRRKATAQEVDDFTDAVCSDAATPGFVDADNPDARGFIERDYYVEHKLFQLVSPVDPDPNTLYRNELYQAITSGEYDLYILEDDTTVGTSEAPVAVARKKEKPKTKKRKPKPVQEIDILDENLDYMAKDEVDSVADALKSGSACFIEEKPTDTDEVRRRTYVLDGTWYIILCPPDFDPTIDKFTYICSYALDYEPLAEPVLSPTDCSELIQRFTEIMRPRFLRDYRVDVLSSGETIVIINGGEDIFLSLNKSTIPCERLELSPGRCTAKLKFKATSEEEFKAVMGL